MRLLLRSLFVWLMALALPLQGIAAAGMQACGPMHEHTGPVAASAHAPGHGHAREDGHRGHAAQYSHSSHAAHLSASAHPASHGDAHPAAAELSSADQGLHAAAERLSGNPELPAAGHQCGACAACCPAVALPSLLAFPVAPVSEAVVIPAAPASVASFVPPGLERPPRAILA